MRKNIIISPKIQFKIIAYAVILNLISLGVFAGALKFYFQKYESAAQAKGLSADHLFFNFLNLQETFMWQVFAGVAVVSIILIAGVALYYSHRFIGPVAKMEKHLASYAANESKWTPLTLRKNDILLELSNKINQAIEHSNKK